MSAPAAFSTKQTPSFSRPTAIRCLTPSEIHPALRANAQWQIRTSRIPERRSALLRWIFAYYDLYIVVATAAGLIVVMSLILYQPLKYTMVWDRPTGPHYNLARLLPPLLGVGVFLGIPFGTVGLRNRLLQTFTMSASDLIHVFALPFLVAPQFVFSLKYSDRDFLWTPNTGAISFLLAWTACFALASVFGALTTNTTGKHASTTKPGSGDYHVYILQDLARVEPVLTLLHFGLVIALAVLKQRTLTEEWQYYVVCFLLPLMRVFWWKPLRHDSLGSTKELLTWIKITAGCMSPVLTVMAPWCRQAVVHGGTVSFAVVSSAAADCVFCLELVLWVGAIWCLAFSQKQDQQRRGEITESALNSRGLSPF